ncbi:MAG: hypothetical protein J3Q66DRAFT_320910 [Benniella sp.]|nr:MAG: hypothetical protein J3Q66DRAFT_320910 [Benniella sp.]
MAEIDQAALEAVQDDITAIAEATEKVELELANKRNELMRPVYEKRREVIAKLPKFWSVVIQNHSELLQVNEATDLPILEHLTDIWVNYDPKDSRNFDIIFTFKENPFFTNKELVKKIVFKDDESTSEAVKIDWKEGKDPSKKRKKGDDDEPLESFFSWFDDEDAQLSEIFAEKIFPEAISIFAGEDGDEVVFGEDDEDDEDDGSVDLEDEDDDDEEDEKPAKKKGRK